MGDDHVGAFLRPRLGLPRANCFMSTTPVDDPAASAGGARQLPPVRPPPQSRPAPTPSKQQNPTVALLSSASPAASPRGSVVAAYSQNQRGGSSGSLYGDTVAQAANALSSIRVEVPNSEGDGARSRSGSVDDGDRPLIGKIRHSVDTSSHRHRTGPANGQGAGGNGGDESASPFGGAPNNSTGDIEMATMRSRMRQRRGGVAGLEDKVGCACGATRASPRH